MTKYDIKLKGVGAATLDRGISLVIAGVVLAGVVAGISWMYDTQKKEEFMNDLHVISTGVKTYYYSLDTYSAIDLAKVKRAGHIPANINTNTISGLTLTAADGMSTGITGTNKAFKLDVAGLPYDLCVISGQQPLNDILGVYGDTTAALYDADNLPMKDASKLTNWETFCNSNAGGTVSFVFK